MESASLSSQKHNMPWTTLIQPQIKTKEKHRPRDDATIVQSDDAHTTTEASSNIEVVVAKHYSSQQQLPHSPQPALKHSKKGGETKPHTVNVEEVETETLPVDFFFRTKMPQPKRTLPQHWILVFLRQRQY